jgi:hypothetical protein
VNGFLALGFHAIGDVTMGLGSSAGDGVPVVLPSGGSFRLRVVTAPRRKLRVATAARRLLRVARTS